MEISPQMWDLLKALFAAYIVYLLNKHDRNMNGLYDRIRAIEINCAKNTGKANHQEHTP